MPPQSDQKNGNPLANPASVGRYTYFIIFTYTLQIFPLIGALNFMVYGAAAPFMKACGDKTLPDVDTVAESCMELRNVSKNSAGCVPTFVEKTTYSVATEFNYTCDNSVWVKNSVSAQMAGIACGVVIFGHLSDWFGRKSMMLIAHFAQMVFGLAASFADSLLIFTLLQFLTMIFQGGLHSIIFVFLFENVAGKLQMMVTNVISYSPLYVVFAIVAFYVGEWRLLLRIVSLLNIPPFVALLFAFESPSWLISKRRLDDAKRVLIEIERINRTFTPKFAELIEEKIAAEREQTVTASMNNKKYHYVHLFCTWKLLKYTVVMAYSWMSISFVVHMVLFNMDALSGSIYWNMGMFGASRYALNLLVAGISFYATNLGRSPMYLIFLSLILLSFGFLSGVKAFDWNNALLIRVVIIFAGVLGSQLFVITRLVTNELFPTAVRNLAVSFTLMCQRGGGIMSPYVLFLEKLWKPLPYFLILFLLALNFGLYMAFIPETHGAANSLSAQPLPDPEEWICKRKRSQTTVTNGTVQTEESSTTSSSTDVS